MSEVIAVPSWGKPLRVTQDEYPSLRIALQLIHYFSISPLRADDTAPGIDEYADYPLFLELPPDEAAHIERALAGFGEEELALFCQGIVVGRRGYYQSRAALFDEFRHGVVEPLVGRRGE